MNTAIQYNHAHAIDEVYESGDKHEREMQMYIDIYFRFKAVLVADTFITSVEVYKEIEEGINQVSILLQDGKFDDADKLNTEIVTNALVGLIKHALDSAKEL